MYTYSNLSTYFIWDYFIKFHFYILCKIIFCFYVDVIRYTYEVATCFFFIICVFSMLIIIFCSSMFLTTHTYIHCIGDEDKANR